MTSATNKGRKGYELYLMIVKVYFTGPTRQYQDYIK